MSEKKNLNVELEELIGKDKNFYNEVKTSWDKFDGKKSHVFNCSDNERVIADDDFSYVDEYGVNKPKVKKVDWKEDRLTKQTILGSTIIRTLRESVIDCQGIKPQASKMIFTNTALFALAFPKRFVSKNKEDAYVYERLVEISNADANLEEKFLEASKLFPKNTFVCLSGNTRLAIYKQENVAVDIKKNSICIEKEMLAPTFPCGKELVEGYWNNALLGDTKALQLFYYYVIREENVEKNTQSSINTTLFYKDFMDSFLDYDKTDIKGGYLYKVYLNKRRFSKLYKGRFFFEYALLAGMVKYRKNHQDEKMNPEIHYSQAAKLLAIVFSSTWFGKKAEDFEHADKMLMSVGIDPQTLDVFDVKKIELFAERVMSVKGDRDVSYLGKAFKEAWKSGYDAIEIITKIAENFDDLRVKRQEEDVLTIKNFAANGNFTPELLADVIYVNSKALGENHMLYLAQIMTCLEEKRGQ